MMRFFKQRWVVALLAIGATLLFITYVLPKMKKTAATDPATSAPVTTTTTDSNAAPQSLRTRLMGPVRASNN